MPLKKGHHTYRRRPVPMRGSGRGMLTGVCLVAVLASPFAGFAIEGRVTEQGLLTGLKFALLPLPGLVWLTLSRWLAWRRLPSTIRQEWREGRVIAAEGAPRVEAPIRFDAGRYGFIELRSEGLVVSTQALLGLQGAPDGMAQRWVAEQAGQLFLAWQDCTEWTVEDDSDGPDFYRLPLHAGGHLRVRRLHQRPGGEAPLLDAVRSIGGLSVRLLADIDNDDTSH
ncbi:MAG: hypothetical protein ACOZE7_09475 [Pseudomonadota bacterium]